MQAELEPDEQPAADGPIEEPMQPIDYARFVGTIAGFMVFFYAVAGVFSAAAAESPLESPSAIAAKVDADWTNAHGTAELSRLYTPNALVIKSTADRFEPAAVFAAAESTLKAQPDVTLTPISAERDGSVVHHIFRTCTAGGSCGNGYFRLEQQTRGAWKIATDVWTLTPYSK